MKTLVVLASVALLATQTGRAADALQAYPSAEAGMVRYVLRLPRRSDETLLKVALIVGKVVRTDAQNRYFFGGRIEQEVVPGWGYTRYVVRTAGPMVGTRMAVDPKAPSVPRFITLSGDAYLVRYNSRLPLVVYVPAGFEVRYRIWSAGAVVASIEPG